MSRRGFTLLEVLVATVILAVAVTSLLSALSTSLRSASRTTETDRAVVLARRKMDELLVDRNFPRMQPVEGRWDASSGLDGGWRAESTQFEAPPVEEGRQNRVVLDRLQLEVWWMNGRQRRSFKVEGYKQIMLDPPGVQP